MKKIVFLYLCCIPLWSQEVPPPPKPLSSFHLEADRFSGYDKYGYFYYIKDNVFYKEKGPELFQYKNLSYGKITRVDIQNPLRIILFFEPFNAVVTLDNQLNETQRINFSDLQDPIVLSAIGLASQNRFWGYNTLSQRIILFDFLKNTYRAIAPPIAENILYYQADFNHFYWIDSSNNLHVCDIFGKTAFLGTISPFDRCIILSKNKVLLQKDDLIWIENPETRNKTPIEIPQKSFQSIHFKDQILTIFTQHKITNYKIILP